MRNNSLPSVAALSAIALALTMPDAAAQDRKSATTPTVPSPSRRVQGGSLLDKPTFSEKFSQDKSGNFLDPVFGHADQARRMNRAGQKRLQALRAAKKKMQDQLSSEGPTSPSTGRARRR